MYPSKYLEEVARTGEVNSKNKHRDSALINKSNKFRCTFTIELKISSCNTIHLL